MKRKSENERILYREVDLWNPLTDSISIRRWLHSCLPFMEDRFELLMQKILIRFTSRYFPSVIGTNVVRTTKNISQDINTARFD